MLFKTPVLLLLILALAAVVSKSSANEICINGTASGLILGCLGFVGRCKPVDDNPLQDNPYTTAYNLFGDPDVLLKCPLLGNSCLLLLLYLLLSL